MSEHFTSEEQQALVDLHKLRRRKRQEIYRKVAELLGYGNTGRLGAERRKDVREVVESSIESWFFAEFATNDLSLREDIQRLLSQYHELGEQILDIEDDEMARRFEDVTDESPGEE